MEIINNTDQFRERSEILQTHFDSVEDDGQFSWDKINAILMLKIRRNWTVESSNSNYQINSDHISNFFPVLQMSEVFRHWRLSVPAFIAKSVLDEIEESDTQDVWINGKISYRHKIQNGYPYIQLTLEDNLRLLKNALRADNQIFFLKETDSTNYFIFATTEEVFEEESILITDPAKTSSDKTQFEIEELYEFRVSDKESPLNLILYGPPGTGKTHNSINHALSVIKGYDLNELIELQKTDIDSRKQIKNEFDNLLTENQIQFVTFHQSYSYEEFVEGIKSRVIGDNIEYFIEDGIFKKICDRASENEDKNFVLIIDEINRGNISKIFGELITLIEPSKRIGESEQLKVKLTYSGSSTGKMFGVPDNLYIIGTMNTADRSIALIDTALRRRFTFLEYAPDYSLLDVDVDGVNLQELLKAINDRIEILLDKDHLIGHSYLMNIETLNHLGEVFRNKIIPLLEEYFYGDYEKIQLVLGDNPEFGKSDDKIIIVRSNTSDQRDLFGKEIDGFEDKDVFQLNEFIFSESYDELTKDFFISIYTKTDLAE